MITALLAHHLDRAKRGEIKNAIRNCHVSGLHSVVLHDEPGNGIRMFYADECHGLAWNEGGRDPMPLAIHSHHRDITLVGVFGAAESLRYHIGGDGGVRLTKCRFESAITGKRGGELVSRGVTRHLWMHERTVLSLGVESHLAADELHTVTVPPRTPAAWLVIEGAEDPDYVSTCYTNRPSWDAGFLYITPKRDEVATWISAALTGAQVASQRKAEP